MGNAAHSGQRVCPVLGFVRTYTLLRTDLNQQWASTSGVFPLRPGRPQHIGVQGFYSIKPESKSIFSVDLRMAFVVAGDGLQWLEAAIGVILGSIICDSFPVSF